MKTLCPVCSNILLRHFCHNRILWFCRRCHQEMPNLELVRLQNVPKKYLQVHDRLNIYPKTYCQSPNNTFIVRYKPNIIELFILQDKKRLEVVGFILNSINIILLNVFSDREQHIVNDRSHLNQLTAPQIKINISLKADFISSISIILMYICQAILFSDSSILNKKNLQNFKTDYSNSQLLIDKSCFLDLIKTLVIDFIYSITSDSNLSVDCFALEVTKYFETVIISMIKF